MAGYSPAGDKRINSTKFSTMKVTAKALCYRACIAATMLLFSIVSKAQSVTLSGKDIPLEKIFNTLKQQTGYTFFYTREDINQAKPVTVDAKKMPLNDFLQLAFKDQPLEYSIENKSVMIVPKSMKTTVTLQAPVEGTVKDSATGQALAGATVAVFTKGRFVTTDRNGHFSIAVFAGEELLVSFVGYTPFFYRPNGNNHVNITLSASQTALKEVMVTNGYQQIDSRKLTSAITTLKAADIVVPGIYSIDQALEGRVPGLFVMNNSGEVGASPKIRIRGTSTVLGSREPVWVVDGVVVNDPVGIDPQTINDLDFVNRLGNAISGLKPFDIEQIDVLKDASATALYGVRAANGVIVITTKKGHAGAPVVSFNNATTYTRRPRYTDHNINVMNSRQRIDYSKDLINSGLNYPTDINFVGYEGALNDLYNGKTDYSQFEQNVHRLETNNTDWFNVVTQDAISTQNNLSISGGNDKINYFASLGEATQQGTISGEGVNQYTSFVKLNSKLTPKLSWEFNLRNTIEKRNYVASSVNALAYAYNTSRALPAYNDDGSLSYYQAFNPMDAGRYNFNIRNEMQHSRDISDIAGLNLNTNLNYKFNNSLNGTVLFSYANNTTDESITYDENTFYAAGLRKSEYGVKPNPSLTLLPYGGELQSSNVRNSSYLVRGQLNYGHAMGSEKRDRLDVLLGSEVSSNAYKGLKTVRRAYMSDRGESFAPVDPLQYPAYAQWAMITNIDQVTDGIVNLASGYFSTSYTFNSKYILNFNTRTDFSNKFGSRSREKFLPTWSASGRWNISDDFFKYSTTVNMLALRASYGYQGNMLENQTPELIIKQGSLDPITTQYYSNIAYYPNPNLKWEKNGEVNLALDFSLLKNKIAGSVTYFHKKTTNAFLDKSVSDVNGRTTYVVNSGNIENQGIELAFTFTPISSIAASGSKQGFVWRIDPQLGQVVNKLLAKAINNNGLNQSVGVSNANTFASYLKGAQIINDKAVNTFYSYQFAGLDHQNGKPTFKNDDPSNAAIYKNQSIDQVYQQVMKPSGNRIPTIQGGVSNSFLYRSFSLSFNLTYSLGSKVRLTKLYPGADDRSINYGSAAPDPSMNVSSVFLNRWRKPGDEDHTTIPGLLSGNDYNATMSHYSIGQPYQYANNIWQMYDNSDVRVASGNYLKLKTMSLRYSLPDQFLKRARMKAASVMLAGTNLYTLASKKLLGQDPEQSSFDDVTQLSPRPTYSFGLDVSF